jgi:dihydroneopterin aldolase
LTWRLTRRLVSEAGEALTTAAGAPPDRVSLLGLRAFGRHGVLPEERQAGQEFLVDAVLWLDTGPAAAADDLSLTVDYDVLARRLAEIISGEPVALIETLAHRLAAACLADERVRQAEVTVHKPRAPIGLSFRDVTVTVVRSRGQRIP